MASRQAQSVTENVTRFTQRVQGIGRWPVSRGSPRRAVSASGSCFLPGSSPEGLLALATRLQAGGQALNCIT